MFSYANPMRTRGDMLRFAVAFALPLHMTVTTRSARFVGGFTMGVPLEIPPLPNVVLTLSTMLGLFAYVYWLAGKDGPPDARA
jgi:hypothetical protein